MSNLGTLVDNTQIELQDTSQAIFQETEIKQAIADAYRYYTMIMINDGEGWFVATNQLAITANQETIALTGFSEAFLNIVKLEKNVSTGRQPLMPNQQRLAFNPSTGVGSNESYIPRYYMRGMSIVLTPPPIADEAASNTTGLTLHYSYLPEFPTSSTTDSWTFDDNFPVIFEPMIVLRAARVLLNQKDQMGAVSSNDSVNARLQEWEQLFFNSLERDEQTEQVEYTGFYYS